jgi:hypothetical protein
MTEIHNNVLEIDLLNEKKVDLSKFTEEDYDKLRQIIIKTVSQINFEKKQLIEIILAEKAESAEPKKRGRKKVLTHEDKLEYQRNYYHNNKTDEFLQNERLKKIQYYHEHKEEINKKRKETRAKKKMIQRAA